MSIIIYKKNNSKLVKHFKKKVCKDFSAIVTNLLGSVVSGFFHTERETRRPKKFWDLSHTDRETRRSNKFWDLGEKSEDYRQRILRPAEKHRTLEDFGCDEEAYELWKADRRRASKEKFRKSAKARSILREVGRLWFKYLDDHELEQKKKRQVEGEIGRKKGRERAALFELKKLRQPIPRESDVAIDASSVSKTGSSSTNPFSNSGVQKREYSTSAARFSTLKQQGSKKVDSSSLPGSSNKLNRPRANNFNLSKLKAPSENKKEGGKPRHFLKKGSRPAPAPSASSRVSKKKVVNIWPEVDKKWAARRFNEKIFVKATKKVLKSRSSLNKILDLIVHPFDESKQYRLTYNVLGKPVYVKQFPTYIWFRNVLINHKTRSYILRSSFKVRSPIKTKGQKKKLFDRSGKKVIPSKNSPEYLSSPQKLLDTPKVWSLSELITYMTSKGYTYRNRWKYNNPHISEALDFARAYWMRDRLKKKGGSLKKIKNVLKKKRLDIAVRCVSVTPNAALGKLRRPKRFDWTYGGKVEDKYFDTSFGQDMIDNKKRRFNMFKYNPISRKSLDLSPNKFFFYKNRRDPIYASYLLEKIINVFSKHGRKSKVRKAFYNVFLDHKSDYDINALYSLVGALRPDYINVPVRKANRYYYAPIKSSPMRSAMRAVRFFKMAVMANKTEKSLEDKIIAELRNTYEFWGYVNPFHHDYVTMSENNKYLAHFRKRRII